jgi:bifunctional DNase/RNase
MHELELEGVRLEVPSNVPVMMLREVEGQRRMLPIYIGGPEASSIHYALEGVMPERPLTHDLLANVIGDLGSVVERVVITEVRDQTYYAELHLVGEGETQIVSCRPSDAVALALRTGSSIFAAASLLDAVGKVALEAVVESDEEILDDFRDFINSIRPEDFGA